MKNFNFTQLNITTPNELLTFMNNNFLYGFKRKSKVYKENDQHFGTNFDKFYKLKAGQNLIKSKYGVCWDTAEFSRAFFNEMQIPNFNVFIKSTFLGNGTTHTFSCFKNSKGKWCWFEFSFEKFRGIWEYENVPTLLKDVATKFNEFNMWVNNDVNFNNCKNRAYIYKKTNKKLNSWQFILHCHGGIPVKIDGFSN